MRRRDGRPTRKPTVAPITTTSGIDDETRQVDAIVIRAQQRIGVGADSEERDVAEIEQAAPADDDVESEREQHVDGDVERHPASRSRCRRQPAPGRTGQRTSQATPTRGRRGDVPRARRCVHPAPSGCRHGARPTRRDQPPGSSAPRTSRPRARPRPVGSARRRSRRSCHTFRMSALPRMPCGRKTRKRIRRMKTKRSDQRVEM